MTEKPGVRFEEAERRKGLILTSVAVICAGLGWLARSYPPLVGIVGVVAAYLMSGDRYQWIYIWKKTHSRDFLCSGRAVVQVLDPHPRGAVEAAVGRCNQQPYSLVLQAPRVQERRAIKDIQAEIPDIPLFQCNSPERESAPVLHNTIPLSSELREMTPDPFTEVTQSKPRDTLLYIYTSGTTGFLLIPLGVHTSAQLSSSDVIYDPLPLHHTAGGVLGAGQAIVLGCTVALRKKFSASNYWSDAARYGCTAHKVKVIIGNGLRPQIWEKFVQRFGISRVLEFYGATEGNSNLVGAIGFLSRLVSSIYPLTLVKCDEINGEILRDSDGRCITCGPHEP
ncbi:Uncharacterized protein OBRU01_18294, partial [Operophtera brumata]